MRAKRTYCKQNRVGYATMFRLQWGLCYLAHPCPVDAELRANFAVTHATFPHSVNISAELLFIGITKITFG